MKLVKKTLALFLFVILSLVFIPQTVFADGEAIPVTEANVLTNTEFYRENPLRIAGNFHLVGFNSVENKTHVNGNILTNTLKYGSNFGTNGVREVSYFRNLDHSVDGFSSTYGGIDSVLVVGDMVTVGTTDNGNSWTLDGGKVNAPSRKDFPNNLWQDTDVKFVDIDKVKRDMILVNQKLRSYGNIGADVHLEDINNPYINILNPYGVNYCNLEADSLESIPTVAVKGFVKDEKGTLVINVDLKGKSSFSFSGSNIYYTDGTKAPTGEVTVWQGGNVVWNFWDSSDTEGLYRGTLTTKNATAGHIIAPQATIDITSNLNGTVISENIIVSAETHRTDFTGPVIYPEDNFGSLTASKTVVGNAADMNKKFKFNVTLSDTSINGEYGNMTFIDGVATFTLKHGESKTATRLPSGIRYTVVEDDYLSEGYVTLKENDTGIITPGIELKAKFVNKKDIASPEDKKSPESNIENPKTGDKINLILFSFLLIIFGGLIAVSIVLRKN